MPDESTPNAQDAPATSGGTQETFSAEYVAGLRSENAAWRTKLRDAEAKLTAAVKAPAATPDELTALRAKVEQMEAGIKQRDMTLLKHRIGSESGLPAALIERLIGEDEDSIAADAARLKAALPTPAPAASPRPGTSTAGMPQGQPQGRTRDQLYQEIYGRQRSSPSAPVDIDAAESEGPKVFRRGG